MNIDFAVLDRFQFNLRKLEDEVTRLKARVTALEAGSPLPPDQLSVAAPVLSNWIEPLPEPQVAPTLTVVPECTEINVLAGGGMTAGGR